MTAWTKIRRANAASHALLEMLTDDELAALRERVMADPPIGYELECLETLERIASERRVERDARIARQRARLPVGSVHSTS